MQVSSTTEGLQDATRHIQVLHLDKVSRKPFNMEESSAGEDKDRRSWRCGGDRRDAVKLQQVRLKAALDSRC